MTMFIKHLEEYIYKELLIYRTVIIAKNEKEGLMLERDLKSRDYNAIYINDIYSVIDYNNISYRIVIITYDKFETLINYIDTNNDGILKSSYNLLAFSYLLNDSLIEKMLFYYLLKTDNNSNETIIYDKRYFRLKYLENIV